MGQALAGHPRVVKHLAHLIGGLLQLGAHVDMLARQISERPDQLLHGGVHLAISRTPVLGLLHLMGQHHLGHLADRVKRHRLKACRLLAVSAPGKRLAQIVHACNLNVRQISVLNRQQTTLSRQYDHIGQRLDQCGLACTSLPVNKQLHPIGS